MPELYSYEAFGNLIHSEIELPQLIRKRPGAIDRDRPTVTITRGELPRDSDDLPPELPLVHHDQSAGVKVYGSAEECFWLYESAGMVRVREGDEIVVSPVENYPVESLRQLIVGPGLRTICVQQGQLALHASAVVIGSTTVAFAGPSGRGKSTAAAVCFSRGHTVLTDDLAAVDPQGRGAFVQPGYPILRLETAISRELGISSEEGVPGGSRTQVDVSNRFATDPHRLDLVYLLEDGERFVVEELSPAERAFALLEISLALYRVSDRMALDAHLSDCGEVASSLRIKRLTRPRRRGRMDELGQFVETDIATSDGRD